MVMSLSAFPTLFDRQVGWPELLIALVFVYICFAVYIFLKADSWIFQPRLSSYQHTSELIQIAVNDQEKLAALYLPNAQATYTLLFIHGNAEDLGDIRADLEQFNTWGFGVFAFDYRGYGLSDGHPSEQKAYQDAAVAYRYLTQQLQVPGSRIIVYGRSLGGASAVEIATQKPFAGLILDCTFTSVFRVILPFPILPFEKFNSLKKMPRVHCPVLIMHGQADPIVPFAHSPQLYAAAAEPKMFLWVPEAGHDLMAGAGDRQRKILASFQELVHRSNGIA
jgi:abhydrolase domain-containing protein 17